MEQKKQKLQREKYNLWLVNLILLVVLNLGEFLSLEF